MSQDWIRVESGTFRLQDLIAVRSCDQEEPAMAILRANSECRGGFRLTGREYETLCAIIAAHPEDCGPEPPSTDPIKKELLAVLNWIEAETDDDPRPASDVVKHAREVIAKAEGR